MNKDFFESTNDFTPVSPSATIVLGLFALGIFATLGVAYAVYKGMLVYTTPFTAEGLAICSVKLQVYCDGMMEMLVKNGHYIPAYITGIISTIIFFIPAIIRLNRLEERTHTLRMMVFGPLLILGAWHFTVGPFWDGTLDISEMSRRIQWYTYIGVPVMIILGVMVIGHTITFIRQTLRPGRE